MATSITTPVHDGWLRHSTASSCGTFPDVPDRFRVLFTLRERLRARNVTAPQGPPEADLAGIAAGYGLPPESVVRVTQRHGDRIRRAEELAGVGPGGIRLLGDADGLITDRPDTLLAGKSADCPLLLVADPLTPACGMAHSGWRGTAAGIGARLVEAMETHYRSNPADLIVFVCPAIGSCCYEVGEEVFEAFGPGASALRVPAEGEKDHLDLAEANRAVLESAGVLREHIHFSGSCTKCNPELFFSYRREGPGCGHLAGLIGFRARAPARD